MDHRAGLGKLDGAMTAIIGKAVAAAGPLPSLLALLRVPLALSYDLLQPRESLPWPRSNSRCGIKADEAVLCLMHLLSINRRGRNTTPIRPRQGLIRFIHQGLDFNSKGVPHMQTFQGMAVRPAVQNAVTDGVGAFFAAWGEELASVRACLDRLRCASN